MGLVKASAIKKQIKEAGFRMSKDAVAQFERKVSLAIVAAIQSAKNDRRQTIKAEDVY